MSRGRVMRATKAGDACRTTSQAMRRRIKATLQSPILRSVAGVTMSAIHGVLRRATLVVLCLSLACVPARADDAERIRALERKLDTSMRLIEQLSARIAELERAGKPGAPPSAAAGGVASSASAPASAAPMSASAASAPDANAEAIATLRDEVNQISEGLARRGYDTGLPVHGFADVDVASSTDSDPLRLRGFYGGTLDLYLTPQFGDRVRSLTEIAFEYDNNGSGSVDVERLQLGYTVSDSLTLWMGRFHTPFGVWNTSFHHGAFLQTSIYRPRFVEFEDRGGLIPAHSVGLWGTGKHELGAGKLTYDVYVANGPSIRQRQLDFNPFTDDNTSKEVGLNLGYQPGGAWRGLWFGGHAFTTRVDAFADNGTRLSQTRVRTSGAYASYEANEWEMYSEYYRFDNEDTGTGITHRSHAGYVHVGHTFGQFTPYLRWERNSLDPNDAYFASQTLGRSFTRFVGGARYALDPRASFKLEFSRSEEAGATLIDETGALLPMPRVRYNRAAFQYSIAF
jgi:hypothetical protein